MIVFFRKRLVFFRQLAGCLRIGKQLFGAPVFRNGIAHVACLLGDRLGTRGVVPEIRISGLRIKLLKPPFQFIDAKEVVRIVHARLRGFPIFFIV